MNRLTMGAAFGGLAVYLFDPESGVERRERLLSLWRENRDSAVQAGRDVSQAAESARPLARRMTKAVGGGDWTEAFDRGRPAVSLPKLIGAAAIGGALVYFLDPVKGSKRRQRLLSALQEKRHSTLEAARQAAKAVTPNADRVSDQVAGAAEGVKSKVR
ncbi:MAG TPA: YtxH domain-containing protein [Candidatus Dormibacteraeota bacterium]